MKNKFLIKVVKISVLATSLLFIASYLEHMSYNSLLCYFKVSLKFIAGVIIGIILPDLDIIIPGLNHRSAITHSCFPVLFLVILGLVPIINAGLAIGISLHLSSDIQSKSWYGTALIKVPLLGSIGSLTPLWLLLHVILCLELFFYLITNFLQLHKIYYFYIITSLICVCYFYIMDDKPLFPVLSFSFCVLVLYFCHSANFIDQFMVFAAKYP